MTLSESRHKFHPGKFHCNYCKADISSTVYISCAVCKEYDLCLDCHMVGAEAPPHSHSHQYKVIDDHAQPIYTENWSLNEEYLLLEAIQAQGLGNWEGVGTQIGRDPKDCEVHYWRLYYNNDESGLSEKPVYLLDNHEHKDAILNNQKKLQSEMQSKKQEPTTLIKPQPRVATKSRTGTKGGSRVKLEEQVETPTTTTMDDDVKIESSSVQSSSVNDDAMVDIDQDFVLPTTNAGTPLLVDIKNIPRSEILKDDLGRVMFVCHERGIEPYVLPFERPKKNDKENEIGWNPLRKAFSIHHDNAAEEYVGGFDIEESDVPDKAELKIKMLEVFEHIMQERDRRIQFVIERGLQDIDMSNENNWRDAKSKRTLQELDPEKYELELHRVFARFLEASEYEKLVEILKKEKELRRKLNEFKMYRENGITTLADVEQFEIETRKKRAASARKAGRTRLGTGATTPTTDESGFELMVFNEQRICGKLNMSPAQFLVIKDALIRESFIQGTLSRKTAFSLFNTVEQEKIDRIFDYLAEAQMIHEEK